MKGTSQGLMSWNATALKRSISDYELVGGTGRQDGLKSPTSCQINCCSRTRCKRSFSKLKSNGFGATGSSLGLCSCDRKGCASACSTVTRFLGWIWTIFLIKSSASEGAPGNWRLNGGGGLFGSFRMKRLAFSEVIKSSSWSCSLPSFSQMRVSCDKRDWMDR